MQTVILRLARPSGDGQLHGLAEVVGDGEATPFGDDTTLLTLLREATSGDRRDRVQGQGRGGR